MFDRYSIGTPREVLQSEFDLDIPENFEPCFNASPTRLLPVLTNESPRGISYFYWGLPPSMGKNRTVSRKLIIATLSELEVRTSYKKALQSKRSLIPADGLFYWKQTSKKGRVPYHFVQNNKKPFLMAGIWDEFEGEDGGMIHTFTVISEDEEHEDNFEFHKPLLVARKNLDEWFRESLWDSDKIKDLLEPLNLSDWGSFPVSSLINNVEINTSQLVQATNPMDQFGNYSLFD